jgi:hypothetical protein
VGARPHVIGYHRRVIRSRVALTYFAVLLACASGAPNNASPTTGLGNESTGAESGSAESTGDAEGGESSTTSTSAPSSDGSSEGGAGGPGMEDFSDDPGWTAFNLPDGMNDYGWSAMTTFAGGTAAGEAGGTFQRSGDTGFYAHIFGGLLGATDSIEGSGRIVATVEDDDFDSIAFIGHFSTTELQGVGMQLAENTDPNTLRVFIRAGGLSEVVFVLPVDGVSREWSYDYDPTGGGVMTLMIEGLGSQTRPLSPEQAQQVTALDAFGIAHTPQPDPASMPGLLSLYIDDVQYTR